MADGMICTHCHQPTGVEPDLGHLSVGYVVDLCENWKCPDCLDDAEEDDHDQ